MHCDVDQDSVGPGAVDGACDGGSRPVLTVVGLALPVGRCAIAGQGES